MSNSLTLAIKVIITLSLFGQRKIQVCSSEDLAWACLCLAVVTFFSDIDPCGFFCTERIKPFKLSFPHHVLLEPHYWYSWFISIGF